MHRTIRFASLLAVLFAATMAMGSCAFQLPTSADSKTSPAATVPGKSEVAAPTSGAVTTDPGSPATNGGLGGFGSVSEACIAVSASMVSVAILPLAGLLGGKSEDVDKAREELSKLQSRVPDELKPHFEKLRAFTEAAGSDFSKYGTGEFEALMKPIEEWLNKNCS